MAPEEESTVVVNEPTEIVEDDDIKSDVIEAQMKVIRNYFNQKISKEKTSKSTKHDKENQK